MVVLGSAKRWIPALCAILVFGSTIGVFAEPPPRSTPSQPWVDDKIGTALDACLSGPTGSATTLSRQTCYEMAQARYEAAIRSAYNKALKHVDPTTAMRLRQSQATWITFRNDLSAVDKAPWTGDRGTIVESQISQSAILTLKARVLEIDLVWPGFAEGDEPLEISK